MWDSQYWTTPYWWQVPWNWLDWATAPSYLQTRVIFVATSLKSNKGFSVLLKNESFEKAQKSPNVRGRSGSVQKFVHIVTYSTSASRVLHQNWKAHQWTWNLFLCGENHSVFCLQMEKLYVHHTVSLHSTQRTHLQWTHTIRARSLFLCRVADKYREYCCCLIFGPKLVLIIIFYVFVSDSKLEWYCVEL